MSCCSYITARVPAQMAGCGFGNELCQATRATCRHRTARPHAPSGHSPTLACVFCSCPTFRHTPPPVRLRVMPYHPSCPTTHAPLGHAPPPMRLLVMPHLPCAFGSCPTSHAPSYHAPSPVRPVCKLQSLRKGFRTAQKATSYGA